MSIRVENEEPQEQRQQPLLEDNGEAAAAAVVAGKRAKTPSEKAVRKTFKGTAHLANLLPTGSVLIFQFLSPIFTHQGHCAPSNHLATIVLLGFCASSCFFLCFTDSFRDARGKVRYALATPRGLYVIEGSSAGGGGAISPEAAAAKRIRFIDVLHAVLSVLVFGAIAVFDQNVVSCFCPAPSETAKRLLVVVPVAVGGICSALFLAFPSRRHGVGYPLSRH